MSPIIISSTDDTPGIKLDAANEIFEITGRSLPEDVTKFYKPILDWLEEYGKSPNPKTVFEFRLSYFNTASSKIIMDILFKLEAMFDAGNDVSINWNFPSDDEEMEEAGKEYSEIVETIPIRLVEY